MSKKYLVSAIVSVYNCERFIRGCLEDLEQQTIADKLEIVIVNSGSQQNEETIIKEFQNRFDNIVYIKTENRETIYQAWNRAIKASSGKYITSANSDDRHRVDAFEIMINELENNPDLDLVYADLIVTRTENDTFENHTAIRFVERPDYDKWTLLKSCYIGPQPLWRKSLHNEFGYFDEKLKVVGDYEFWLRASEKNNMKHLRKELGLYLENYNSAEHRNPLLSLTEDEEIKKKYTAKYFFEISRDKKLLSILKKDISKDLFHKGYKIFVLYGFGPLAKKIFIRSISYNWFNFKSYKGLFACYMPSKMIDNFRKLKIKEK